MQRVQKAVEATGYCALRFPLGVFSSCSYTWNMDQVVGPAGTSQPGSPAPPPRSTEPTLQHVGRFVVKRVPRHVQQPPETSPKPVSTPRPATRTIGYAFAPYPVELADLERRHALPPTQLRILALRRFANPVTGEWVTSTREVAELIGVDRTTAQKALRLLERSHGVHIRHLRSRTVQLVLSFGGFSQPEYRHDGKAPLRWDPDFTPDPTEQAQWPSQKSRFSHTAVGQGNGSSQPNLAQPHGQESTPPRIENRRKIIRKETFSTGSGGKPQGLFPVATFVPQSHDDAEVQELARKMNEAYVNSFFALRRQYGLNRLERACAFAQDKLYDPQHPFRSKPGAYVQWLLTSGVC